MTNMARRRSWFKIPLLTSVACVGIGAAQAAHAQTLPAAPADQPAQSPAQESAVPSPQSTAPDQPAAPAPETATVLIVAES